VAGAVEAASDALGGLDTLVSNAGVELAKPLVEHTEEEYDRLMAINVKGVWLGTKLASPVLAESGRGVILNMASVAGAPLLGIYCASKAAVIQLTRVAAIELRDSGIRVNAVCPSFVGGDMVARMADAFDDALPMSFDDAVAVKQGRYGTVEEVARLAVFLASERSAFSTGGAFVLDGGATASLL
jgi:NAD(P)-dependent dehydrogenase (short-subunit alcohol dehydrogenase family)